MWSCISIFLLFSVEAQANIPETWPGKIYLFEAGSIPAMKWNVPDGPEARKAYDMAHVIASLQGIVNRNGPRLFIRFSDRDDFWWDVMKKRNLELGRADIVRIHGVNELIQIFRKDIKGAVVYDPKVWSTSNVASTIAGVEDLIAVRYDPAPDSFYTRIIKEGPRLPVVVNLAGKFTGKGFLPDLDGNIPSSGSAKCDAYLWAKAKYLDAGKCNASNLGYYVDSYWLQKPQSQPGHHCLFNHDYFIARKAFFFDLSPWADEAPVDDPSQPLGTDRKTMEAILRSAWNQVEGKKMIHIGGFLQWDIKYTQHVGGKHGDVEGEWECARLFSAFNGYKDADALGPSTMPNASFYAHHPMPKYFVQNPPPTREQLTQKGFILPNGKVAPKNYVYFYVGDYDSAAWVTNELSRHWENPDRGSLPLGWAINPNLSLRNPVAFDYFYFTKTPNDYFVAGDNGAGYSNPMQLLAPHRISGLPSADQAWIEHNLPFFRRFNYSITPFVINGVGGSPNDEAHAMYTHFSADGLGYDIGGVRMPDPRLFRNMPLFNTYNILPHDIPGAVNEIRNHANPGQVRFIAFRSILKPPTYYKDIAAALKKAHPDCQFECVDPYTYVYLMRHHLGGSNEHRATYMEDSLPPTAKTSEDLPVRVVVRNDGWDTWKKDTTALSITIHGSGDRMNPKLFPLNDDVPPGGQAVIKGFVLTPEKPADYKVRFELKTGDLWFEDAGDLAGIVEMKVE